MKTTIYFTLWTFLFAFIVSFSFRELLNGSDNLGNDFPLISYAEAAPGFSLKSSNIQKLGPLKHSSDARVDALIIFFKKIQSPLVDHVDEIVLQADKYGIDYALVPAISMQESNGCKVIPVDSYNCWGFGIYGSKVTRFTSYEQAIRQITKTIKESYIKKGLTNPTLLEDKWAPPSKGIWSYAVNYYLSTIHNIERNLTAS